ncbi:MAG: hypothetical protein AAFW87_06135 [Pseudomonadota bacterium]
MKRMATLSLALAVPVPALAQDAVLPPAARHCVEAIVNAQDLQTSAMVATTPEEAGRPKADPRSKLFMVPDEKVVFGQLDLAGRRACVVFPQGGTPAWPMEMIDAALEEIGLVHAADCSSDEAEIWFSTELNDADLAMTTAVILEAGEVREVMAFETKTVSKAEDCADAGRD